MDGQDPIQGKSIGMWAKLTGDRDVSLGGSGVGHVLVSEDSGALVMV